MAASGVQASRPAGPPVAVARAPGRAARWGRAWRWGQALFPSAPALRITPWGVGLGLATVAGGAALSLARTTGPGAYDSVWAEDGMNFLTDALSKPVVDTLLTPINGYFITVSRVVAELTTVVPVRWAAAVMSIEAAVLSALLAVGIYLLSGAHTRSTLVRLLVAAPLLVAPVGQGGTASSGGSVINNLATVQFPLLYALFWVLLWVPAGRLGRIVAPVFVLAVGLTTPLAVVYLPLAILRVLVRRDGAPVLAALLAGALVQYGALAAGYSTRGPIGTTRLDPGWVLSEYARWTVPNALLGEVWWRDTRTDPTGHAWLVAGAWLLVLAAVVVAGARLTRPNWPLAVAAALGSLAMTGVQLASLGSTADRYLYTPGLLLLAAVAVLLAPGPRTGRFAARLPRMLPAAAMIGLLAAVGVANFRVENHRTYAVPWHQVVNQATDRCAASGESRTTVRTHSRNGYWTVTIPCRKLG